MREVNLNETTNFYVKKVSPYLKPLLPGYNEVPNQEQGAIMSECEICNDKKLAAKTASDASSDLFFACFVKVGDLCSVSHSTYSIRSGCPLTITFVHEKTAPHS